MNDPLVRKQSLALADRLLDQSDLDEAGRLDLAYRLTVGRPAREDEVGRARTYLAAFEAAATEDFAANPVVVSVAETKPTPAPADETPKAGADKKPAPPVNPDEIIPEDAPIVEEVIRARSPRVAAWASFCQALLGSAEFRYLP
jgi:hypothetical protein